jgi:ribosomal protein S18 acetylase RimI-like enzyme
MKEYSCLDCRDSGTFPLDQIKKLDTKYFEPVWGPRQWSLLEHANRTLVCFWMGEQESEESLVKSLIFGELNEADSSFEIFKVITVPELRRSGLATRLFESLKTYSDKQSLEKIFLQVAATNQPALKAYERWGFVPLRTMKNYYGNGLDAIELIFRLNAS